MDNQKLLLTLRQDNSIDERTVEVYSMLKGRQKRLDTKFLSARVLISSAKTIDKFHQEGIKSRLLFLCYCLRSAFLALILLTSSSNPTETWPSSLLGQVLKLVFTVPRSFEPYLATGESSSCSFT